MFLLSPLKEKFSTILSIDVLSKTTLYAPRLASGAMALFGSDSKQVEKAIQNVIAVQGVLNGVQQVGQLLTAKGIVQDQIANAGMFIKANVLKAVTRAQWLWNAAVTAFPVTALIVGIGLLVGGIYKLIKGLKDGTITSTKYQPVKKYRDEQAHIVVFMNQWPDIKALSRDRYNIYCIDPDTKDMQRVMHLDINHKSNIKYYNQTQEDTFSEDEESYEDEVFYVKQ